MDRMKRIAGMAKGSSAVPVWKDEDESLVLFGEMYKREKEKDVNLLEPMYSVEFEAIQGEMLPSLFSPSLVHVVINGAIFPFIISA